MLKPVVQPSEDRDDLPRPNIKRLRDAFAGPFDVRSLALTGLFVLAVFYTLYFARSFFLPVVLALLLNFLLSPVVRALKRIKVPEALGAGLVLLGLVGGLAAGVYNLSGPAYQWLERAPSSLRKVESKLRELTRPVQTIGKATEEVEKIATVGAGTTQEVAVKTETLGERILARTTALVSAGTVMFVLLYFLLASGDLFLRKLIKVLPNLSDKKRAVEIARQVESDISAYLTTITVVNILLGIAVTAIMYFLDLPNPLLWGVMAAVLNYIPYLGAIVCIAVLAVVGLLTFDSLGQAMLPPLAFVGLNIVEAYIVTPMMLGRRLTLNPVVIFLGLTFWGWLWGIAGALLAVPLLAVLKIFCDRSEPLASIGEFLGD